MNIQERTANRDKLFTLLTRKGFLARKVTVYNCFEECGTDVPGIMVSHNYNGPYPSAETWTTFYSVKKLASAAGFHCEERGYYTATLIR